MRHIKLLFLLIVTLTFISGCAISSRQPVPEILAYDVNLIGYPPSIRSISLSTAKEFQHDFSDALVAGGVDDACDQDGEFSVMCVLVVSGGGGSGAYGAGFLKGWSETGTRPRFKIVTGVSTGSLIAPFAFLGSDWDEELADAMRSIRSMEDLIDQRNYLSWLFSDSLFSSEPFQDRLELHFTEELIDAIGLEYRKGRRLYIGTTHLDLQSFVVWNMGAIAASKQEDRYHIFRQVLLASSSIPVIMPPVHFNVTDGGVEYEEMHVDGGVQSQFFVPLKVINLSEAVEDARKQGLSIKPKPRMYVIRNSTFLPGFTPVERKISSVGRRALDSLIQSMGRLDLNEIYSIALARGSGFFYTEIPAGFKWKSDDEFDGEQMDYLYEVGYDVARSGERWMTIPRGPFSDNLME